MDDNEQAPDPLAQAGAVAIACARLGLGLGIFGLTRRALAGLGFGQPSATTVALARLAGGRDIALGLHGLAAVGDRSRLREATRLGVLVDAGDAIAFAALARDPRTRGPALRNAPLGLGAAVAGAWLHSRL